MLPLSGEIFLQSVYKVPVLHTPHLSWLLALMPAMQTTWPILPFLLMAGRCARISCANDWPICQNLKINSRARFFCACLLRRCGPRPPLCRSHLSSSQKQPASARFQGFCAEDTASNCRGHGATLSKLVDQQGQLLLAG